MMPPPPPPPWSWLWPAVPAQAPANENASRHSEAISEITRAFFIVTSFIGLEADILEGCCGLAVQPGRLGVFATTGCQVALRHPRRCAMADRFQLICTCLGGAQRFLRLVESSLLHQRAAEHELGRSDVEQEVFAALEEI